MGMVIRGKGPYWAERSFTGKSFLTPDFKATAEKGRELTALIGENARFFSRETLPTVIIADSSSTAHPHGEALVGFNAVMIKDLRGRVAGYNPEWLLAHEFAHTMFSVVQLDKFFAGRPDLVTRRERLMAGIMDGSIDLQINHWQLFDALYKKYFSGGGVGKQGLLPLIEQWERDSRDQLFVPYSFIEKDEMREPEREIFNAYVLFTLIDMTHKQQAFAANTELVEQICNYLACVVAGISVEEFAAGPHAIGPEKEEWSTPRNILHDLTFAYPVGDPHKLTLLVQLYTSGNCQAIANRLYTTAPKY